MRIKIINAEGNFLRQVVEATLQDSGIDVRVENAHAVREFTKHADSLIEPDDLYVIEAGDDPQHTINIVQHIKSLASEETQPKIFVLQHGEGLLPDEERSRRQIMFHQAGAAGFVETEKGPGAFFHNLFKLIDADLPLHLKKGFDRDIIQIGRIHFSMLNQKAYLMDPSKTPAEDESDDTPFVSPQDEFLMQRVMFAFKRGNLDQLFQERAQQSNRYRYYDRYKSVDLTEEECLFLQAFPRGDRTYYIPIETMAFNFFDGIYQPGEAMIKMEEIYNSLLQKVGTLVANQTFTANEPERYLFLDPYDGFGFLLNEDPEGFNPHNYMHARLLHAVSMEEMRACIDWHKEDLAYHGITTIKELTQVIEHSDADEERRSAAQEMIDEIRAERAAKKNSHQNDNGEPPAGSTPQ